MAGNGPAAVVGSSPPFTPIIQDLHFQGRRCRFGWMMRIRGGDDGMGGSKEDCKGMVKGGVGTALTERMREMGVGGSSFFGLISTLKGCSSFWLQGHFISQ